MNKDIISKSSHREKMKLVFQQQILIKSVIKCKWKFKNTHKNNKLLIKVVGNALKHL